MASKVFIHVGLPKTATTYLQTILWGARDQMRAEGVLLPGDERRDHLWASNILRGKSKVSAKRPEYAEGAWDRLKAAIASWPGTALISHEFFAAASADQAHHMITELAPAEVHVIVTAREPLGLFTASWQESIKNRATTPLAGYSEEVSDNPLDIWNWRTLDLKLVLERWGGSLPPQHVHVLPLPGKDFGHDEIWHRFAGLIGLDSHAYDLSGSFPNESLGVVESETLRRINEHLGTFRNAYDRGVYIRTYLADERLVPRGGERYWPDEEQIAQCRTRGAAAAQYVEERGFDLIGSLDDLRVPNELVPRRHPSSVTDAEVAEVAVELVATIMEDVRDRSEGRRALKARVAELEHALNRSRIRSLLGRRPNL